MQIAIDLQDFLSYLDCIQCILSYTQIELNSGFGSHLSKERKTRSRRKNKNKIIENETSLFTEPLVETGATAAKTKPESPSLLLGSSGSAPKIGGRLSPTATTAQSLYSGSQMEHRHFFDACSQRDLSRLAGLGQRRRRSWRFICQAMASPTIQDCARKVCRKDIMSTVASRGTNRCFSEFQ